MSVFLENGMYLAELPKMSLQEADEAVKAKDAPKVTRQSIVEAIEMVHYHYDGVLTIAKVFMKNGFIVVGKSACASPENYDIDVGETYAYEDAIKQLWVLEGYLLRQRLHEMYEGHRE